MRLRPETISVSDLTRATRKIVNRLTRERSTRLLVLRNNRPVAVIGGVEAFAGEPAAGGQPARKLRDEVLARRDLLRSLAAAHGARSMHVFGSVARGEERAESDIDFLVELEPGRSLLDLIGLKQDLEQVFGRDVDVFTRASLKRRVLKGAGTDALRVC
jgi:hypothetical protein